MKQEHDTTIHTLALTWAANVQIKGRADAVANARKVLIWLTAQAGTIKKWYNFGEVHMQSSAAAKALSMNLRTLYRSLTRLEDQGMIVNSRDYGYGRRYKVLADVFSNN